MYNITDGVARLNGGYGVVGGAIGYIGQDHRIRIDRASRDRRLRDAARREDDRDRARAGAGVLSSCPRWSARWASGSSWRSAPAGAAAHWTRRRRRPQKGVRTTPRPGLARVVAVEGEGDGDEAKPKRRRTRGGRGRRKTGEGEAAEAAEDGAAAAEAEAHRRAEPAAERLTRTPSRGRGDRRPAQAPPRKARRPRPLARRRRRRRPRRCRPPTGDRAAAAAGRRADRRPRRTQAGEAARAAARRPRSAQAAEPAARGACAEPAAEPPPSAARGGSPPPAGRRAARGRRRDGKKARAAPRRAAGHCYDQPGPLVPLPSASMYAVIKVGGKQYKVEQGQTLLVDRQPHEPGKSFTPPVLMTGGDESSPTARSSTAP